MECRKKLTGDILEQPRSLEFLCRTCGVVECGMCSLANHTKSECAIVKLTEIKNVDMNKWCEEVQTVMTTLNFTTDWEKKLNHTGLSFAQCEVDRKTEEITKAISHQFAIMINFICKRRDQLIIEANMIRQAQVGRLQKVLDFKTDHANKLIQARKIAELICHLRKPLEMMSKAELIEFLQKKFQIDQILISSLPVMLKPETNESQVEMAQFNWKKIEEELLLNIISTFGAVRCGIEDSKETSPEQQSGAKLDVNPIVTDRLGENSQEISRGIEQMSQPFLADSRLKMKRKFLDCPHQLIREKRTKLSETGDVIHKGNHDGKESKYALNLLIKQLPYETGNSQESDGKTAEFVMELFNVTLGLKSVLGKSFSVVDFTTIKRVGREKETIRDVLVGFVRQNDRDYVLATTKTSGKLMTFQKRQKLAKVPCTRICAHHEPLRAQQLGYLLKVRSQLIYKLNFARRDIIMDEYAEPEPTLQVKSHIYSASQLPHDIYGDVGAFVSKTLRSQQLTEKTE